MIEPKYCPFCGGTNLDMYRFTRAGFIDKPAWYEEKSATGDWFRIECNNCGCTYDEHEDGLYDRFYDAHDFDVEFTEECAWDMAVKVWNDRALTSPSEEVWDYCTEMARKGEWSGSYETDMMIACAKKVLEEKEKEKRE